MILIWGANFALGNIWQCLETFFFFVTYWGRREMLWASIGKEQRTPQNTLECTRQFPTKGIVQSKISVASRDYWVSSVMIDGERIEGKLSFSPICNVRIFIILYYFHIHLIVKDALCFGKNLWKHTHIYVCIWNFYLKNKSQKNQSFYLFMYVSI